MTVTSFGHEEPYVQSLEKKHQYYKDLVDEAHRLPSTDQGYLKNLKKQKLKIKEELHRYKKVS